MNPCRLVTLLSILIFNLHAGKAVVVVLHEGNDALKKSWIIESIREDFFVYFPKGNVRNALEDLSSRHPESPLFMTGVGMGATATFLSGIEHSKYLTAIAPIGGLLTKHVYPEKSMPLYFVSDGSTRSIQTSLLPWLQILEINPFQVISIKAKNTKQSIYGPNADGEQVIYVETDKRPEQLTHDIWQFFKINNIFK